MSKLHLDFFLWLFVLWLGGAGVTTCRLPFLVERNGVFANWRALVTVTVEFMLTVKGHLKLLAHSGDMLVTAQTLASIAVLVNTDIDCAATGVFNSMIGRVRVTLLMAHWIWALVRCGRQHCGSCHEQVAPGLPMALRAVV